MKKKRIRNWFYNRKIGQKLIVTFLLAVLLPTIFTQYVLLEMNQNQLEKKIRELMVSQLVQISERVDLTLEVYMNLVYQMNADTSLIEQVKLLKSNDPNTKASSRHEIYHHLQEYNNSLGGIRCISLICSNGTSVTYDWGKASAIENIWKDYVDLREIEPYKRAQESSGIVVTPTSGMEQDQEDIRVFQISKTMYDLDEMGGEPIATIVITLDESVLKELCQNGKDAVIQTGINFILDEENHIITYPDSFFAGVTLEEGQDMEDFVHLTGQLEGKEIGLSTYIDSKTNWTYYNACDLEEMLSEIKETQRTSLLLGIAGIAAASLIMGYTIRIIGSSVKTIISGIQEVKGGNLNGKIRLECEDELGQISENFNAMTERVNSLVQEVTEATGKQKNAEIKALEAQINPHFLYNTLDSINWMAISRGENEISEMIRNLGVILRYSVNKSNAFVTIDEVVDWMEKYISLQQMRFDNAFDFQLFVQKECRKLKIKKLLIQPFLENTLLHGFKGIESGGMLHVDIALSEDAAHLCIIIEDNGNGMEEELVKQYNDREEAISSESGGIGLHNVFSRIDMYYGEDASWNVSSIRNMGTIVTLKIPVNERSSEQE